MTMKNFEIELRYEVLEPSQLSCFVTSFEKLHQKHDVDIYLDNPEVLMFQKGIFIRIRNDKKLDLKFNRECIANPDLAIQDYCEEHSFNLPLQESDLVRLNELLVSLQLNAISIPDLEHFKSVNNLRISYVVDKLRASYRHDSFIIGIDEVVGLGMFLEIELMADSIAHLDSIKKEMQQLLKGLSLKPLKTGYGTLLLRKNNFDCYLLGRFILDKDKVLRKPFPNNVISV